MAKFVGVYLVGIVVVFFLLALDYPLSNDIRGAVFFASVVRLLFSPADKILVRKSEN